MSENFDPDRVDESVIWLVNKVKESHQQSETQSQFCKLNDYTAFETPYIIQAMDSEDRI